MRFSQVAVPMTLASALFFTACGPSYPKCDADDDCHKGEFCVNGQCQLCRSDADCKAGESCNGGRCDAIANYCTSAADCPSGQDCQGNRCVANMSSGGDSGPGICELQPVYFGFDADALDGAGRAAAQADVNCMRERNISGLQLTGLADPRGTEEYNLALGDRRAKAVVEYLKSLGVDPKALGNSSMGEETATGTDEASWSRDRRVDVKSR